MSEHALNVSVVIPTFNSEAQLGRCLDSVLSQGAHIHEVLVIDGGSTDATLSIARSHRHVTVVDDKVYSLTQAWNAGIQRATGEWVGFIDSDDWWSVDALASQASAIAIATTEAGFPIRAVTGHVAYRLEESKPPTGFRKDLLEGARLGWMPGTTLVQRSLAQRIGPLNEHLGVVSDIEWVDRLRKSHQVAMNSTVVLFKSVRESSISMQLSQSSMGTSQYAHDLLALLRNRIQ